MKIWQQDWISRWALYSPERIAIQEQGSERSVTYRDLNEMANGIASYLTRSLAIKKGDRIVVLAEYSIEYIALFSAAQKTGLIIVPLNYRLSAPEIKEIIDNADPVWIYYQDTFEHLLPKDRRKTLLMIYLHYRLLLKTLSSTKLKRMIRYSLSILPALQANPKA